MRTPLFHEHVGLGARIVDFHGWEMPVWYTGIREEHLAVRHRAGIFDVSHMGEILVEGPGSADFLDTILTRDITSMKEGRVLYTFLLNERGGIIDDLMVCRLGSGGSYLLCVNASNRDKDLSWIKAHAKDNTTVRDASDEYAMIALQGPSADEVFKAAACIDLNDLRPFGIRSYHTTAYGELLVSRTGYTGAGGVEIYVSPDAAPLLWRSLVRSGATPCGLGARDTLRLEMGYPLHGNDITEETTPLEAGLEFAVDLTKRSFIGMESLLEQRRTGISRRLTGIELLDRGIPREHCRVVKDGVDVGVVTSGSMSPVTGKGIALAYLAPDIEPGVHVEVDIRARLIKAVVKDPPFVQGAMPG